MTQETTYTVAGLTCSQCLVKLMDHVRGLRGVQGVDVDLVRGGESVLLVGSRSGACLDMVEAAVGEAGFDVTGHWPGVRESS